MIQEQEQRATKVNTHRLPLVPVMSDMMGCLLRCYGNLLWKLILVESRV